MCPTHGIIEHNSIACPYCSEIAAAKKQGAIEALDEAIEGLKGQGYDVPVAMLRFWRAEWKAK